MRRINTFAIFIFLTLQLVSAHIFSQEKEKTLSFQFENLTIKECIHLIEENTNYAFYYQDDWFNEARVDRVFNQIDIKLLLKDLLKDTSLNFTIYGQKIILTKNNIIRTSLPINYFSNNNKYKKREISPNFLKDYTSNNNTGSSILTIGKEKEGTDLKEHTITGYIRSVSTERVLKGVKVFIPQTSKITYTNEKGYYYLQVQSGYNKIEAAIEGFENNKKEIVVFGNGSLDFKLDDKIVSLGEVVIVSDKDDNVRKAAIGHIKVDVKGMKTIPTILGERDILKVFTTMPGVKTTGEGTMGYNVRGGKTDQNLILLDNAVLYNPSHFFGVFSGINPFSTGNVDIYKGNIPSEYGGRLSSVINISTKKLNNESFTGEGNIGPITGNLTFEIPLVKDKAGVLMGVRSTYSNWILKKIPEEALNNSEASFFDGIFRFDSKLNDNNSLKATAYYSKDQFSISSDSIYKYNNTLSSLEWNHKSKQKHSSSLQMSLSNYQFSILNDGLGNQNFDLSYMINELSAKYKRSYHPNKQHSFAYGLSSKLYAIRPGELKPLGENSIINNQLIPNEKAVESAVFISDELTLSKGFLIDLGFRYSFYTTLGAGVQNVYADDLPINTENLVTTKTYSNNEIMNTYATPEVRVAMRYSILSNLSLKVGYNKSAQYIHRLSSNTTASPVDSWKLSNLNIKPIRSDQFSMGLFQSLNKEYDLSLEAYYKDMKNIIDFRVGAKTLLNETIETELLSGDGKAYGIEFLLKKKFGKLNGWLSYSYTKSLIKLDSKFLSDQVNGGAYFSANYDKPHDLSLIANYKLTKRYSFSFNFVYQSGRPITYPIGKYNLGGVEYVLYSDRNQYRIPDYYRFDVGVNIEGNHKIKKLAHSFWNISVYNVLGRNNPYSIYFLNEKGEIKAYKVSIFSVPIPTITYNFKF